MSLGKALYSYSASLHVGTGKFNTRTYNEKVVSCILVFVYVEEWGRGVIGRIYALNNWGTCNVFSG